MQTSRERKKSNRNTDANAVGPNKRVTVRQINFLRPFSFLQVQSKRANSVCGPTPGMQGAGAQRDESHAAVKINKSPRQSRARTNVSFMSPLLIGL